MLLRLKTQSLFTILNSRLRCALSVTCILQLSRTSAGMSLPSIDELANNIRSNDGLTLLMSSTDGYCSTLAFTPGELGQIYNGHHPTMNHPTMSTGPSVPTPISTLSPSLAKALPAVVPSLPSPAAPYFTLRPTSPARSNSQSSIATMSSVQTPAVTNNPTPTLTHLPMVTATTSSA